MNDNHENKKTDAPFDVDDIVKKIDEQIAKIEEEERRLKGENNDINMNNVIENEEIQIEKIVVFAFSKSLSSTPSTFEVS